MVSPTFASILRSGRSQFNESFVVARRLYPDLEPENFSEFLRTRVDAVVDSVAAVNADHAAEVAMVAYDTALALVGQRLAGPNARLSEIEEGWSRILPKIPVLVSSAPTRIFPAISNAIYLLATTPNAQAKRWIETMETLSDQCVNMEDFLKLGQFVAWLSGLAHLREGALKLSDELPEPLTLAALQVDPNLTWAEIRPRLLSDPWFNPSVSKEPVNATRVVARVGAFRGFGGLFTSPPLVVAMDQHFLTRSGDETWLLTADCFGATFHRATFEEFQAAVTQSKPSQNVSLDRASVAVDGERIAFPDLGYFTSSAISGTTLALTSSLTHSIILVALHQQ